MNADAGIRTLAIYRDTYRVTDDGHGGSVDVDHDVDTTEYVCTGGRGSFDHDGRTVVWVETPAREAVGYLYRENLSYGADGGEWFGHPEPYDHPYDDTQTETTAHLHGAWTDTERRAIVRMVEWLTAQDDRRATEYASRT